MSRGRATPSVSILTGAPDYIARMLRSGLRRIQVRDFKGAEEDFGEAQSETPKDPRSQLHIHKAIAKAWLDACCVPRALPQLRSVKSFADQLGLPYEKMKAYRDMGICYQLVRKYESALVYFKKLLELAWYENNMEMELCAYDNIGKQYYYLSMLDKAAYYSNRAWHGILESKDSPARLLARNAFEARRKPHASEQLRSSSRNSSDLSGSELPSPISNSSTSTGLSSLQHKPSTGLLPSLGKKSHSVSMEPDVAPFVLISHLSLNRSLKNYQCLKDARKIKGKEDRHKAAVL